MIDNKIHGGAKRYTHQQYGLGSIVDYDASELRWFKKSWVPEWLFRWFAKPDMVDLLDRKMSEAERKRDSDMAANIRDLGR